MEDLTLEGALDLLLERVSMIEETESVPLMEAVGRVLAAPVRAWHDQPPFPRSPLDGYAVRSEDIKDASPDHPVCLKVLCETDAGHVSDVCVTPGTAVRIMTGAPIPDGADCVIAQEKTDYGEETAQIYGSVPAGGHYCQQGEDYKAGDLILEKGTTLGAVEAGVMAGLGCSEAAVYRRPRVAVITTGDELIMPGEPLKGGKIYDSNLYTVVTRLKEFGAEIVFADLVNDVAEEAAKMVSEAAEKADLVITTGGVSVGKKDIMHEVIRILGCEQLFWRIAIKPGMPTLSAEYDGKLLICLSGNPYGAAANTELLVRPILAKMSARSDLEPKRVKAVCENGFPKKSPVTRYVRANYSDGHVRIPDGSDSSGILSTMCGCNCLIEIPAGTKRLDRGDSVWVVLL